MFDIRRLQGTCQPFADFSKHPSIQKWEICCTQFPTHSRFCFGSYYLKYRTRTPKDRNTKCCLGSSFTKHWESVNHLGGSPCPIPPMPTRSWVPQAPGPLWKSGGSTGRPTIFYFNYTSDVLLFVFDWYYDVVCRKMYLYETGDDKDTCMYCLFCCQTILHVKSQETPSVHA